MPNQTVEEPEGFGPGFSRNVEAVLKVLASGGFYNQGEYRDALRMAGLPLGPDVLPEMPEFTIPGPPDDDDGFWDEEVAIDAGDDPEGDDDE